MCMGGPLLHIHLWQVGEAYREVSGGEQLVGLLTTLELRFLREHRIAHPVCVDDEDGGGEGLDDAVGDAEAVVVVERVHRQKVVNLPALHVIDYISCMEQAGTRYSCRCIAYICACMYVMYACMDLHALSSRHAKKTLPV